MGGLVSGMGFHARLIRAAILTHRAVVALGAEETVHEKDRGRLLALFAGIGWLVDGIC